jgi:hypothetical protein
LLAWCDWGITLLLHHRRGGAGDGACLAGHAMEAGGTVAVEHDAVDDEGGDEEGAGPGVSGYES